MKPKWRKREKLLFLLPLLCLAPYLYMALVGRHTLRHPWYLLSMAYAPDGQTLVTGCGDNLTRLWNVKSGRLEETLPGLVDNVMSVAVSPDNSLIASVTDAEGLITPSSHYGEIRIWRRGNTSPLWTIKVSPTTAAEGSYLSFSPDSRTLAGAVQGISLWDMQTGRLRHRFGGANYELWSLTFSPDGRTLAAGDYDGKVKLWDANTGRLRQTLVYSDARKSVRSVAFSPDGRLVAGGGNDGSLSYPTRPWTVKLWNAQTGALLRTIEAHGNNIRTVKFAPSGKVLASGAYDNLVKLWDVKSGQLLRTLPHKKGVSSLDFSPDGKVLATGCDDARVRLWEMESPR